MAETAAVIFAESNRRNRHAKPLPTTCEDVENSPEVKSKLKPVIAVAAMRNANVDNDRVGRWRYRSLQDDEVASRSRSRSGGPSGLLVGDELGSSLGAFSPSTVGDRLGES
jgi:hypothetical protein